MTFSVPMKVLGLEGIKGSLGRRPRGLGGEMVMPDGRETLGLGGRLRPRLGGALGSALKQLFFNITI